MRNLAVALLLAASGAAAAQALNPTADAYVRDGTWANTNFGTSTGLFTKTSGNAGQNYDSYLKFDVSSVGGVGSVASAKLRINASLSSGSLVATVYAVSSTTWSETAITWNNKPARGGALASTTVTGSSFIYYEFDVSNYLIAEKAAGRNIVSFALHNPAASSQTIWMGSREGTSGRPQLVITPNVAPTVALTSPAAGAVFQAPATITLAATAADADGTVARVDFFDGATPVGTATAAPYGVTLANVAAGAHTYTARATDNLGVSTTSGAVTITVNTALLISGQTPKDVTLPGGSTPLVGAAYTVQGGAIDVASVRLQFNGVDVTSQATVTESGAVYQVTQPLANATHAVALTVATLTGSVATDTWTFVTDDPAPNFYGETPRDVFVANRNPRIRVLLSGFNIALSSIRILLDGGDVTTQADVGVDHIVVTPASPLGDGLHTVNVTATDGRGASAGKQWSFTVALPPPPNTTEDGSRADRTFIPRVRVVP